MSQGGPAIFHLCLTLLSSHCPHTFFLYSASVRGFSPCLAKLEPAAMPTDFLAYQYGWFLSLEEIALEDWTPVSSSSTFETVLFFVVNTCPLLLMTSLGHFSIASLRAVVTFNRVLYLVLLYCACIISLSENWEVEASV